MRVAVTGGTGFIGRALVRRLQEEGHSVIVLSRDIFRAKELLGDGIELVHWEAGGPPGPWERELEGVDAIVNLAGENIFAKRWSPAFKAQIWNSRVHGTRQIVKAIARQHSRPRVLINASAIGFYGARGDEPVDEKASRGADFLAQLVQAWEAEAEKAESFGLRVVCVRIGVVLERGGGALARMLPAFRLGLGGPIGSGGQYMSWIHRDDVVGIMLFALNHGALNGIFNATAPEPITNKEFSTSLGRALHRPAWLPVPASALNLLLGEAAYVVLTGQRVVPKAITAAGYEFLYPQVNQALQAIV
jgi:uncharacterized protein (TIGR01777 family)